MVALSERKIEIVRSLVEAAPDKVVGGLEAALGGAGDDTLLSGVRQIVELEAADRRLRNSVLAPIAPMCVGDGRSQHELTFPYRALTLLWRGLRAHAPEEVDEAAEALAEDHPGESAEPFDVLVRLAAVCVRDRAPNHFAEAAALCDAARPDGADQLAACLELGPIVRRSAERLPEWIAHPGDQTTAGTRLAYKDAVAISDDAGPRFFEMIAAQLPQPWMVLRIISSVMDKPTERYLRDSELAGFAERVMQDIDDGLLAIARIDLEGGAKAAREAGRKVELITLQIGELEGTIELVRDHGWGHRIGNQRKALASVVEGRMRDAERHAMAALPTQPARLARIRRSIPRLTLPPDPRAVTRAVTLLSFSHEVRSSANYGGFAAARTKMLEKLGDFLDLYVEEVLDFIKTGDVEDEGVALQFLEVCATFSLLVRDERAADLVRRRALAACQPDTYQQEGWQEVD